MEKKSNPKQIKCPQCGQQSIFSSGNPFRPFCSERCRLIDLGAWASESYKIPVAELPYETIRPDKFDDDSSYTDTHGTQ